MAEEHWDVSDEDIAKDFSVCEDKIQTNADTEDNGAGMILLTFLLLWTSFYGISAAALNHLLQFLHYFFSLLAPLSPPIAVLLDFFPSSLYKLKKILGLSTDEFEKYVICPECSALYTQKECLQKSVSGLISAKPCNHIEFRNHPFSSHRNPCGHKLLKEVITKTGKKFYPIKSYCYYPLVKSMSSVLSQHNLIDQCEQWRSRNVQDNTLADIYDGRIWKEFMTYKGKPFLSMPYNLGLMLNCDWFQPFDLSTYSVGVLYLVILNLPRAIRFKPENVLIAGIIPGPKEPSYGAINSYLRPLVKELNHLWTEGFSMKHNDKTVVFRAALLATVCDVPATAKLGGFVGHMSKNACWKCSKQFSYNKTLNRVDFSGIELGPLRDYSLHKRNGTKAKNSTTPSERSELELESGSRFTELFNLPYYDCNRFAIIDPMHNLLLGTPKRILHREWLQNGLISKKSLEEIQEVVCNCTVPNGLGRIPLKISSNFSNLTADEWKNWTLLFSPFVLHNYLPPDHLECWQSYISACKIYCSSLLTLDDINRAAELMRSFFISAESLYGASFLSINTHLHLHLPDVYKDYGPCYGYWLFSFERYNGILGKYHTNQLSIEIQLMRRFIENIHVRNIAKPFALSPEHYPVFKTLLGATSNGSASDTLFGQATHSADDSSDVASLQTCNIELLPPFVLYHFDRSEFSNLMTCYQKFISDVDILEIPQICRMYNKIIWLSQRLKSSRYPKKSQTCVLAHWVGRDGQINDDPAGNLPSAGRVEYFFSQRLLLLNGQYFEAKMACIKWFQEHNLRQMLLKPAEIWQDDLFKSFGPASFIPLDKIMEICVFVNLSVDNETVIAINPITKKFFV